MRVALTTVLLMTMSSLAAAQSKSSEPRPWSGLGPIGLPLPSITPTLPPIGLGLPQIGLPLDPRTPIRTSQRTSPPNQRSRSGGRRHSRPRSTVVYVVPAPIVAPLYVEPQPPPVEPEPAVANHAVTRSRPAPPMGVLQLDLVGAPPSAQIYVDDYFVGTLRELSGQLRLEPGAHQVAVHAVDHETLVFDTKISADQQITYEATMKPVAAIAPKAPASQPSPATLYFIPGCYLGNVRPVPSALPANCDIEKLTTYKS